MRFRDAKTDEERRALAKKLADLVRSSPQVRAEKPPKGPLDILGDAGCVYADGARCLTTSAVAKRSKTAQYPIVLLSVQSRIHCYDSGLRQGVTEGVRRLPDSCGGGRCSVVGESAVFCNDQRPMDQKQSVF